MTYLFETSATMKPHNSKKWWIDPGVVRNMKLEADSLEAAISRYAEIASEKYGVEISKNALKNKQPVYIDTADGEAKQVGFVVTGKTEFRDDENYRWSTQYIYLWVDVSIVCNPFEMEV
jgi:hypothetical protein